MAADSYDFITHWRVRGTCQEVFEIIADAGALKRWWPSGTSEPFGGAPSTGFAGYSPDCAGERLVACTSE